jgi:hypothetical protein
MPVTVFMAATLMSMMMVVVPVTVVMRLPVRVIVRLERRRHFGALKSVLRHQSLDLRLLLQPDAVGQDLHRHMAIAERQDEARRRGEILGAHLEHRFDVGHDFHKPAIVEHQEVVRA